MKSRNIIKTCNWEITKRCNLNCIHCISSTGDKGEMDTKSVLDVIDILKDWGCKELYFTGGEPLAKKEIFTIFKKAKNNGIKIALLSNGTLINRRNIKLIKKYIDEIGISLDGSSSEINDLIRGEGVFEKIINSIKILRRYKIPVSLYSTICKLNINDFENIFKLINSLEVESVRVNEVSLRGRAYRNRKKLAFSKGKKLNLKSQLFKTFEKFGYRDEDFLFFDSCEIDNKNIFLSPKGFVYPCIEIYQQKPDNHLGNILGISKENFKKRRREYIKSKPRKCPYQFMVRDNLALCLNDLSVKCKFSK